MEKLNVLIGCERSQVVCEAFRRLGHNAFSCDTEDSYGNNPEWHLKMDIFDAIDLKKFEWNIAILHPPCTKIAVSGNGTYGTGKPKNKERFQAIDWTQNLWNYAKRYIAFVALENPVGCLNSYGIFPKPQYIQPWQFGHSESKKTGLWLHNLPKLKPTNILQIPECGHWDNQTNDGQNKLMVDGKWISYNDPRTAILRSKTYNGIAEAMAEQWSSFILNSFEKTDAGGKKL